MPVYNIESKDDPRVAVFRELPRSRDRSGDGRFIAEGRVLVERLWRSGWPVESVFADESHRELAIQHCDPETPIFVAPKPLLEATIGFNFHRGLLACGVQRAPRSIREHLANSNVTRSVVMVLDQVVDQENMGGMIRNAAALGATAVLIGPNSAQPFSRRVLRVSMGAVFNLPPMQSADLVSDIAALKQSGYQIVATALSAEAVSLSQCPPADRVAILFGNEGDGVAPMWLEQADALVTIPMQRGVDSLNVASASAIFLHHFCGGRAR